MSFIGTQGGGGGITMGGAITGGTDTQILFNDGGVVGGDAGLTFNKTTSVLALASAGALAWSTDLFLRRGGPGVLAIHNLTNAQTVEIYGSRTDASNYFGYSISVDSSKNLAFLPKQLGTGIGDAYVLFQSAVNGNIRFAGASGSTMSYTPSSGTLQIAAGPAVIQTLINGPLGQPLTLQWNGSTTSTSGTVPGLTASYSYAPTATSTMLARPFTIATTINYSNGTPGAGSYEALRIIATETALPTGQSYLIRACAGAAGTTDRFMVQNDGTVVMGTHSTVGVELITGYITIKDIGGTTRKLAVIS